MKTVQNTTHCNFYQPEPRENYGNHAVRANEQDYQDASNAFLAEYNSLREEVLQKIQLHNTILMFAITSSITIFVLAFTTKIPEMFLLPLVVVVPATWKAAYYKVSIIKLGTYISTFIESRSFDLKWETRASGLSMCKVGTKWVYLCVTMGRYLDLPMVGISSVTLYVWGIGGG